MDVDIYEKFEDGIKMKWKKTVIPRRIFITFLIMPKKIKSIGWKY